MRAAADLGTPGQPADPHSLLAATADDEASDYSGDDAVLYALGIGFGNDPAERGEFAYAYRQPLLKTVPTFATMLPKTAFPSAGHGWDAASAVYVEEKLELYRPLPVEARLLANRRVIDLSERPDGKSARIVVRSEVRLAADETALFARVSALAPAGASAYGHGLPPAVARYTVPKRDPDLSCNIRTRSDQSLLFCHSGDHVPLHTDPDEAKSAGFESPLLHARCVFGIACRAILRTICDYDYTLLRTMEARFTAPVFPGDVVRTDMWQDRNVVSFRCVVRARQSIVLDGGRCTLSG